jgi:hypothetical protein
MVEKNWKRSAARTLLPACVTAVTVFAGTGGAGSESLAQAPAEMAAQVEAYLKDEEAALTPKIYEALVLALADCAIKNAQIDGKCPAAKNLQTARGRKTAMKDLLGFNAQVGAKLIGHESPAVRLQAAKLMGSAFGADASSEKIVLEAAAKEKDPAVLRGMVDTVGSKLGRSPAVLAFVKKAAEHESEEVRLEALSWMATSFADGTDGTLETVLAKIESDPSKDVRTKMCTKVAGRRDERALPLLERLTADPGADPAMYKACLDGLTRMWHNSPRVKDPSEKAYRLTLQRLQDQPRSGERPPWMWLSDFKRLKPSSKTDKSFDEWHARAPWFKREDILEAMKSIVADRQAATLARRSAVDVLVELDAPKEMLTELAAGYADAEGKSGDDSSVLTRLREATK